MVDAGAEKRDLVGRGAHVLGHLAAGVLDGVAEADDALDCSEPSYQAQQFIAMGLV